MAPIAASLVNEASLRLLGVKVKWNDRHHFYALAARAMRFVLVDFARRNLAKKRSAKQGGPVDVELPVEIADPNAHRPEEVLMVHQALARLARINARQGKLVELRYFAGMSLAESATILGISTPATVRDWRTVRI